MKKLDRTKTFEIKEYHETSAADTLKELLDFYSITQTEFAERIGVSQAYISEILNRKKFMSSDVALAIEAATGIASEFLLRLDLSYQLAHQEKPAYVKNIKKYDWATA